MLRVVTADADNNGLEWSETTGQAWFETVEKWPWTQVDGDWVKTGICPRCEHEMDGTIPGGVVTFGPAAEPVVVVCNCRHSHKGRPNEYTEGCGQNARISPPR
jgi:hypothetical protein